MEERQGAIGTVHLFLSRLYGVEVKTWSLSKAEYFLSRLYGVEGNGRA